MASFFRAVARPQCYGQGREHETETFAGAFEDHSVPAKLTTDFVTDTLNVYTGAMLNEVSRLFDPIARLQLTDTDTTLD
ncbi:MAG: hypothetical protein KDB03_04905 [Planctomycetales bacterium]|nr:hypothetical protein [Planctomycetales bacterium]